jgi:uncharacterized membrane protein
MTPEEKLDKLMVDVAVIKSNLERLPKSFTCLDHAETFEDHEGRLRKLEQFTARFLGALLFVNVFTGIVVALIVAYITTGRI